MREEVNTIFKIVDWKEESYTEIAEGGKLTRARVTKTYSGDIEGDGTVEYLMAYQADGNASFVGHERIVGRIKNRTGSVVFQHTGVFESGVVKSVWSVVPGSGTDELRGLCGEVTFSAPHQPEYAVTLNLEFE